MYKRIRYKSTLAIQMSVDDLMMGIGRSACCGQKTETESAIGSGKEAGKESGKEADIAAGQKE